MRYAQNTNVSISKTRHEIDVLLQTWGAEGIQWTDEYKAAKVTLRFLWRHEGTGYMARFTVKLPSDEALQRMAVDGRSASSSMPRISQGKLDKLKRERGQQEYRVLLLWLKAALNAVEAGIVKAEEIFLPFLEGKDGQTVAEVAIPRLPALVDGSAFKLLGEGSRS